MTPQDNNQCAYRLRVMELIRQNKPVSELMAKCESCSGYSSSILCSDYLDLEHLIKFAELRLR